MKRPRYIVYWNVQDTGAIPPWPLCAGHRDTVAAPLMSEPACSLRSPEHKLLVTKVDDGICALAAFGNCKDEPVCCCDGTDCKCIPELDVCCLDREEM